MINTQRLVSHDLRRDTELHPWFGDGWPRCEVNTESAALRGCNHCVMLWPSTRASTKYKSLNHNNKILWRINCYGKKINNCMLNWGVIDTRSRCQEVLFPTGHKKNVRQEQGCATAKTDGHSMGWKGYTSENVLFLTRYNVNYRKINWLAYRSNITCL